MHVAISLPVDARMPVEARPYMNMLSVQLGGLNVVLTPDQARRLLGQLARHVGSPTGAGATA